jgi:methyl-accepting chemotaxis protein
MPVPPFTKKKNASESRAMKIQGKLTGLSLVIGLVPLLIAAVAAYLTAAASMTEGADNRLSAIRDAKKQQIELYFDQIHDQVLTLSGGVTAREAMNEFAWAFETYREQNNQGEAPAGHDALRRYYTDAFGAKYREETGSAADIDAIFPRGPAVQALQAAYIANNPNPLGQKENLDFADDGSPYALIHARYHPVFRQFLREFGYYDIFLVDDESGHIVYSVFKELDFATSLLTGPYKDTNFAEVFRKAAQSNDPNAVFLEDFAHYGPSYEAPASFIASPVFNNGQRIGVLIFQMPIDRISNVLSQKTGMGETGEVYLVGADRLMRSNSRFDKETTILAKSVDTQGVAAALNGETGTADYPDYRGVEVRAAYSPVDIDGVDWAILAEIDASEALAAVSRLGWFLAALTLITAVIVAAAATLFARRMAAPVIQAAGIAQNISNGSLDNTVNAVGSDENADLLRALDAMQQDLKRRIQSEEQAAQNERIKAALDSVDTAVVATDTDNRVIYVNQAAEHLLNRIGQQAGQAIGRAIDQTVEGLPPITESADRFEHRWQAAQRVIDVVGGRVVDAGGAFRGWVVQFTDRTDELAAAEAERARVERELATAAANTRIKVALDNVGSAVMVADTERNIIYANRSAIKLFSDAEPDIRKQLPGFDAATLVGSSIDAFHRHPRHQADMVGALQGSHQADMEIGGRSIRILANPVIDESGERLGTAVEWEDRTAQVAVEREIDALVEAAGHGDLQRRIDLAGKEGFFHQLGMGFNALLDQLAGVFGDIAQVMGKLADGDLRQRIENDYAGTFDGVKSDINRTMDNLREIVGKLAEVADQVDSAVGEITSGNSNLSSRTEQQAASLEETASSLEQLTATVGNNAENAQQANQLAAAARDTAQRGGDVVAEAIAAMEQISTSSKKIGEIVGVIDEIAFQTNLLALNASVEAARAGEQGRGFAVVATEVRNLASRSADAAKEIKDLIRDSGAKVEVGAELVGASGKTLDEIVTSVKKVGDIIAEIAAASSEQASGIDQVNRAVSEMDSMTQQNAALAEQTSAASLNVGGNAKELKQLVDFFRTA